VAAAGNAQIPGDGGLNADDFPVYPAAYDLSNILSVAALDRNDQLWSDSYFGQTSVDLGAPGVTINSTIGGSYGTLTGTSMAAPQVTGAAALLLAENPGLSRSELKSRLLSNVIPIPALDGKTSTGGKLNLLELFMPDPAPPARVEDLTVIDIGADYIQLSLTATGDDGNYGQASAYEVRFHPLPLTEANFYAGFPVEVSSPAPARSSDVIILNGLNPSINYYIALRVVDDKGNKSPVSNSVSATTEAVGEGFSDDMESGSNQWIADGFWHLSSRPGRYGSPSNAFLYGQENPLAPAIPPNYNDGGINQGSLTSRPFLLTGFETPILRFSYFKHTESNSARDTTSVMIITDSGTDTLRTTLANNLGPLVVEEIDLLAYKNQMVRLKFHFDTVDQYLNNYEGWYIDDVEIFDAGDTTPPSPPRQLYGPGCTGKSDLTCMVQIRR